MDWLIDMLEFPFMQRAFITGIMLGATLAVLGVIATLRKMAFFGEGIAHASLAGIAIAIFAGLSPLPMAIVWAILVAILIFILERSTKLPSDSLIGILFTASMAIGVIIMSFTEGYQPELLSFLFGSILTIQSIDVWIIASLSTIILTWMAFSIKDLTHLSLSEEGAIVHGIHVKRELLLFYIALAIATVLGVKILGIILVSALIVLPAATSRMVAKSFKSYLILSVVISEIVILSGLALSFVWDMPSGAIIVLVGTSIFLLTATFKGIKK